GAQEHGTFPESPAAHASKAEPAGPPAPSSPLSTHKQPMDAVEPTGPTTTGRPEVPGQSSSTPGGPPKHSDRVAKDTQRPHSDGAGSTSNRDRDGHTGVGLRAARPTPSHTTDTTTAPPSTPARRKEREAAPWVKLAEQRRFKEAAKALEKVSPASLQGAATLMRAAEVMRFAGQPARALSFLEAVEPRYSHTAQAPLALFMRGRILMASQPCRAAPLFARLQGRSGPATLKEDALSREIEALARCGRRAQAHRRAQLYRTRYPNGLHRHAVHRWSPPPSSSSEDAAQPSSDDPAKPSPQPKDPKAP
ncbi:MAG: hypothetical protein AAFX99_11375, partial [Myxococcota bacterium]